jgi:hypothetical protein
MKIRSALLLMTVFFILSCRTTVPVDYSNYEVQALEQGVQGTVLMKVYSYDKTVDSAIERAKMNAVQAVLFKGIPGSNVARPMVKEGMDAHKEYFEEFFGLYKIRKRITKRKQNQDYLDFSRVFNAPYKNYVQISNDGTIAPGDRVRVGNSYKVGVVVSVNHRELRKKLETDRIIRGINQGF